jgi:hypothetical protein
MEHSQAQIEHLSVEIAATVPQLAGYIEQLEHRRLSEQDLPVRFTKTSPEVQVAKPLRTGPRIRNSGSMQYNTHFGDEPSPFRRGVTPAKRPSEVSVFNHECDGELSVDTPTQLSRPMAGPQPASVYHMLFQLYTLRSITSLSAPFKDWVRGRIKWMENITNHDDLVHLQEMVVDRPGDGFPIGEGG